MITSIHRVPRPAWVLAGLGLLVRLAWVAVDGFHRSPDVAYYLGAADRALADGLWSTLTTHRGAMKYVLTITFATVLRALFGVHAVEAWVLIGVLASALATLPLYFLARDVGGSRAAVAACVLYASSFDLFQWSSYPLTDTIFASLTILFVAAAARAARTRHRVDVGLAVVSGLSVATLRVPGVMVVAATLLALTACALERRWSAWSRTRRWAVAAAVAVALVAGATLALVVISSLTGANPSRAETLAAGEIVDDDPTTWIDLPTAPYPEDDLLGYVLANPGEFAVTLFLRMGAFWSLYAERWSLPHHALNVLTLLPIVLVGWYALLIALRRRPADAAVVVPATVVPFMSVFHALTLVDYDFRYRAALLPLLAVFAAGPLERVARRLRLPRIGGGDRS